MNTDTNDVLQALIDAWPSNSNYVAEWHVDDQALYHRPGFLSFQERNNAVLRQQQERVLAAVEKKLREKIADDIKAYCELRLKIWDGAGGYDCCGCSTYDRIVEDAVRIALGGQ